MDEDKRDVSCSFCRSKWSNKIALIAVAGILSASLSSLSANPNVTTSSKNAASTYPRKQKNAPMVAKPFRPTALLPKPANPAVSAQPSPKPVFPPKGNIRPTALLPKSANPTVLPRKSVKSTVSAQTSAKPAAPPTTTPNVRPTTNSAAPTKQAPKEFPLIKPIDAASAQSRNQYSLQKCCHALKNLGKRLSGKDAGDAARELVIFVVKFTVRNADLIYGQALRAKMTEKPKARQICFESLNIALEQALPFAKSSGCFEDFIKLLGESYGPSFDLFKRELQEVTHLSKNRPDDDSAIRTDFSDEYAQTMEQKACAVIGGYSNLFTVKNFPEEIATLLAEYAEEIKESMANARKNLGTSQAAATLNRTYDEFARFIVSKADAIAQKFPNEEIDEIYRALVTAALPFILPIISQMGALWAFVNGFKNVGIPSLRKIFETKFRSHGKFIAGIPDEEEKEQDIDQSGLTEPEKRAAARRRQEEKNRREAAALKYISSQIDIVVGFTCESLRNYLDIFQKRDTPNWPI
jgi:hypothetical protein